MSDMLNGVYRAKVLANKHKAKDGWVFVRLTNRMIVNEPFWAAPAFSSGQFYVPAAGDHVFIMFEEGYLKSPIYFGQFYLQNQTPSEISTTYPSRRLIKTKKGHKIEFEETDKQEMISITSAPKNGKSHNITLDVEKEEIQIIHSSGKSSIVMGLDGKVFIKTDALNIDTKDVTWKSEKVSWKSGEAVELIDKNGNSIIKDKDGISVKDKNNNRAILNSKGVKILDKFGGIIEMKSGHIKISCKGQIILAGGTKGVVRVGDSARPHTHRFVLSSPVGPVTGTIFPASVKFDIGSQRVKSG